MIASLASYLFYLSIIIINWTVRLRVVDQHYYDDLKGAGEQVIFIFWHQSSFVPIYHYRHRRACILTMKSFRGKVIAGAARRLGYQVVQLEKENDPVGSLQILRMVKNGFDANIAIDGPTGPIFKAKPGAFYLAKSLKCYVLPVAVAARPAWRLNHRWDKYFVPLPFAKAAIVFGQPFKVTGDDLSRYQLSSEAALNALTAQAGKLLT